MASKPQLPQPVRFYDRIMGAWNGFVAPDAKPVDENPAANATPSDPAAPPASGTYSRAYGGFSISPQWLQQLALNDDTILKREGQHDLALYDAVLDDDVSASAFQQRRLAVISRPWEIEPGDKSALAVAAADHLRLQINAMGWDGICDKMLFGRWYGYAVGECMWKVGADGKIWLDNILVPDRKWFGFTNAGELRLRTTESPDGEVLPPNKFWAYRTGASHDFTPYGTGLAHWCYWPVWFKKNIIKFWAVYLEKYGMPTTVGTFPDGAGEDVVNNTLQAAQAVATDRAVVKPDNVELDLLAEGRASNDSYAQFCDEMNDALLRVILSQTGTSKSEAQGLGGSQSNVMQDVRNEVVRADSDMLHEGFNRGPAAWLTAWNFGPNCPVPRVYRIMEDPEDVNKVAERDAKLYPLGIRRTEESVRETYGEGYELHDLDAEKAAREAEAAKAAAQAMGNQPAGAGGPVANIADARAARAAQFAAQDVAPLYVYRALQPASARALLAWARSKGIPNLEPLAELHVTVLYSKQPVDWFDMGEGWPDELTVTGGPRKLEKLGDKGAIVLRFASGQLKWRHAEMIERGASHDYEDYLPHVTVAYAPDFDLEGVEPFQGELVFGPEIFEPIEPSEAPIPAELIDREFSAEERDNIDRWSEALATEAEPFLAQFAAELRPKLEGVRDVGALRVILLDALERFPAERLGELTGLPFVAVRAGAEAGLEKQVRP
jgi:phage gp29-like protein